MGQFPPGKIIIEILVRLVRLPVQVQESRIQDPGPSMSENMKSIRNRITIRDEREKPYCPRTVEETEWRLLGLGDGRHLSPVQTYVHSYYSTTVQYEAPSTYSTRRMRGRTSSMNDVFMEIGGRLDRPTTDIFLCVWTP